MFKQQRWEESSHGEVWLVEQSQAVRLWITYIVTSWSHVNLRWCIYVRSLKWTHSLDPQISALWKPPFPHSFQREREHKNLVCFVSIPCLVRIPSFRHTFGNVGAWQSIARDRSVSGFPELWATPHGYFSESLRSRPGFWGILFKWPSPGGLIWTYPVTGMEQVPGGCGHWV